MEPQSYQDVEPSSMPHQGSQIPSSEPFTEPHNYIKFAPDGSAFAQLGTWFLHLSPIGKLVAFVGLAIVALALIGAVLQLIAWSIQLALLGVVLFLLYRTFLHSGSPPKSD